MKNTITQRNQVVFKLFICLCASVLLFQCSSSSPKSDKPAEASAPQARIFPGEKRLSNLRKLTNGGTNAEAYWSFDGKWLTYQHSGQGIEGAMDPAPCDQIYKMKWDGTEKQKVSNGKGRTTCSYYTHDDEFILYSSTHAQSAECPQAPDKSKGYVWPIYSSYQLYRVDADKPNEVIPMEPGAPTAYNAEMTVCKNGKVVFTSDRNGDLDLYLGEINKNGFIVNIKQYTNTLGYDGGAFFSQDCSQVIWRASRPKKGPEADEYISLLQDHLVKPGALEIWIGNVDGSSQRQITRIGAASFAPYLTPDNQSVLFSSNIRDPKGRLFDIYKININGTSLEQITFSGSFDSFPMISPDGKKIAFSSNREGTQPRETNVFVADWNGSLPTLKPTLDDQDPANRAYAMVEKLSSHEFGGRGIGTEGLEKAQELVIEQFKKIGIEPFFERFSKLKEGAGFRHAVELQVGVEVDSSVTTLKADQKKIEMGSFYPAPFSSSGGFFGTVIPVEYGIIAPELGMNDYENKKVKDKIVLIKRGVPSAIASKITPAQRATYTDLKRKVFTAKENGAKGVVFYEDTNEELPKNTFDKLAKNPSAESGIPVLFVSQELANSWLNTFAPVKLEGNIILKKQIDSSKNILGIIGNPKCTLDQTIIVGAHLDHLGMGGENSLEASKSGIHHGADDNASGIAALLETARILKATKGLRSCVVFAAFTAEETGTVGSTRLMDLYKKQDAKPKAMLNFDMVGRLTSNAPIVFGVETAKEWRELLKNSCNESMLECKASGDGYGPSDQMPFYLGGVPVLHFFTGTHNDYHRVSDTVEKVNATGIVQIAELAADLVKQISHPLKSLTLQKVSSTSSMGALRGVGDRHTYGGYLGTIPDYAEMSSISGVGKTSGANKAPGVKLSGVRPNSPSEKAGIKAGDTIQAITLYEAEPGVKLTKPLTHTIANIDEYMFVLSELKPGSEIGIDVLREQNGTASLQKLKAIVGKK